MTANDVASDQSASGDSSANGSAKKEVSGSRAPLHSAAVKTSRKAQALKGEALTSEISYPVEVSVRSMLEAGAHFGHQTQKWNPKMLPHIYCAKNGIHILNLDGTLAQWTKARKFIVDMVSRGGNLLFVGTKLQARDIVREEALRSGSYYVTTRWLGGTLSNFQTIKNSIERMRKLEELLVQSEVENSKVKLTKKEKLEISREVMKLEQSLGGIRNMKRPPDVIFVIDVLKETIAVEEARRLRIPVVALTDTNADPDRIEFPVPSNDDATRSIRLFVAAVGDAVIEGRAIFSARPPKERQELLQLLDGRAQAHVQSHVDPRERGGRDRNSRQGGRGGRGGQQHQQHSDANVTVPSTTVSGAPVSVASEEKPDASAESAVAEQPAS